jgi:hypothetical protein
MLNGRDAEFLNIYCDNNDRPLSDGKWKKLYSILRELADKTNRNIVGYETDDGWVFEATTRRQLQLADYMAAYDKDFADRAEHVQQMIYEINRKIDVLKAKMVRYTTELAEIHKAKAEEDGTF